MSNSSGIDANRSANRRNQPRSLQQIIPVYQCWFRATTGLGTRELAIVMDLLADFSAERVLIAVESNSIFKAFELDTVGLAFSGPFLTTLLTPIIHLHFTFTTMT